MGLAAAPFILPGCANGSKRVVTNRKSQKQPNVILVITDDQGYGDVGCLGNTVIQTPTLDRLHEQSVRLTNFHVGSTCAPTRAALMTGRYCNRTGVWHTVMGRSLLRKDEVTMADVFSAGGYRTGIFGKWHLGDNYPFRPQDRGFQETLIHGGGGIGQTPDYWDNDYFDDTYRHNGRAKKFAGYCTDVWFDEALRFVELNKDKPFFVYLTTNAPHSPFNVAEKYSNMYRGKNVPNPEFYGMITNIDENMAGLLEKLKLLGLEENTILIFMTDNGTAAGFRAGRGYNAGMRGTKGSEYDGGHRVPCFIRWPGGEFDFGTDVDQLTAHVDLLPTLIEMCGLERPRGVKFDGMSLAPLLKNKKTSWPDRVLVTDSQRIEHPQKWRRSAVMTDRWRLVNGKELHDMKSDPGQKNNVADKYPDVVEKLRRAYEDWWWGVSQRFDEQCEIIIGSGRENPVRLTCHDWHGEKLPPWNQDHIRDGLCVNGFWAVEVVRPGRYEFNLRRWPLEVDKPINAAIPGGKAIIANQARLKIADVDIVKPISPTDTVITFDVLLNVGKASLQTWFTDDMGNSRGAYYVYVRPIVRPFAEPGVWPATPRLSDYPDRPGNIGVSVLFA
jgi:arylsulfatase A-like enzyme